MRALCDGSTFYADDAQRSICLDLLVFLLEKNRGKGTKEGKIPECLHRDVRWPRMQLSQAYFSPSMIMVGLRAYVCGVGSLDIHFSWADMSYDDWDLDKGKRGHARIL